MMVLTGDAQKASAFLCAVPGKAARFPTLMRHERKLLHVAQRASMHALPQPKLPPKRFCRKADCKHNRCKQKGTDGKVKVINRLINAVGKHEGQHRADPTNDKHTSI